MRVTLPLSRTLGALLLATACSSGTSTAGPSVPVPTASGPVVWADGTVLRGTVTIPVGSTVTLAPGAQVRAAKDAKLVVFGSFLAPSGGAFEGDDWDGLDVGKGGAAVLTGVAITGASQTLVAGSLTATTLRYDKAGSSGIVVSRGATLRLVDSVLFGNGKYEGDMITTDEAKELTVSRTEVKGVHCAFHLVGVDRMTLDALSLHDNAYGFMAYGSKPGVTHRITNTDNLRNRDYGLLETPGVDQGQIVIDGGFWGQSGSGAASVIAQASGKITRTHAASAPR